MRLVLTRGRQAAARRRSFVSILSRAAGMETLEERCVFAAPLAVNDAINVQQGTVASSTEYVAKVLADAPVSYWRLNEAAGNTLISDTTGANNGTLIGTAAMQQQGALMYRTDNYAIDFSQGNSAKIDIPTSAALNPTSFTIELWAKLEGGTSYRSPLTSRNDPGNNQQGYIIYASPTNTWEFWTGQGIGGGWGSIGGTAIVQNKWTHIVATFEATGPANAGGAYPGVKSFYIDGALVSSTNTQTYKPSVGVPERIGAGASETAGQFFFDGKVDEVAVYNKVLTLADIRAHYQSSLLVNDTDADLDVLAVMAVNGVGIAGTSVTTNTAMGGLITVNQNGTYSYNQNGVFDLLAPGTSGTDSFNYTVTDGNGGTSTATATITVSRPNTPPVANNDSLTAIANVVSRILPTYSQTFPVDTGTGAAFSAVYPEFTGATAVSSVQNGLAITASGESELIWTGSVPSANIYTVSADITANTGSPGSYNVGLRIGTNSIVFHPGYGGGAFRVEGTGGFGNTTLPWTPAVNVTQNLRVTVNKTTGVFTVVLTNGSNPAQSYTATFTNLASVNGPIALRRSGPDAGTAVFDNLIVGVPSVLGNDTDIDVGTNLSVSVYSAVSTKGAAVTIASDGTFAYDPRSVAAFLALPRGASTTDSFTYTAIDGNGGSSSATVNVTVIGVNDPPVVVGDSYSTGEDSVLTVPSGAVNRLLSNDSDPDTGDSLIVSAYQATSALGATVVVNADGSFTYNPATSATLQALAAGATRIDTFTYTARDSNGATTVGTASVTVTGTNDLPIAGNDFASTTEDAILSMGASLFEAFNTNAADAAAFAIAYPNLTFSAANGGSIVVQNGRVELSGPGTNVDQLVIAASPAGDMVVSAGIGGNANPGSFNVGIQIGPNKIVFHPGLGGGAFRVEGPGGFGNQTMPWTPALNVLHTMEIRSNAATGLFTIKLTDGSNSSNVYTQSFTNLAAIGQPVSLVRSGPTAGLGLYDNLSVVSGGVLLNDSDPEGASLTVTQLNGSASLTGTTTRGAAITLTSDGRYTYNPTGSTQLQGLRLGQSVVDSFTYTVSDGAGGLATATVSITVAGLNDAPVAVADSYTTTEDLLLSVSAAAANRLFANDTDRDIGDTFTVSTYQATSAQGATVLVNPDGSFTYNPATSASLQRLSVGQSRNDTFTYTIRDVAGATSTATVTVLVTGVNDAPVVENEARTVSEDGLLSVGTSVAQTFDTPAANAAAFAAAYPGLTFSAASGGNIVVQNGRVELSGPGTNVDQLVIAGAHPGDMTVIASVGGNANPGSFNVGIRIGDNKIVFHPGYVGAAFRVEGPGGFGNTDVGWTPALNVLHTLKVQVDAETSTFTVTFTDGSNPLNSITRTFVNPSSVGGDVALVRSGPTAGLGLYDNLRVTWGTLVDNDVDIDSGTAPLTVTQLNGSASLTGVSTLGAAVTLTSAGTYTYNPATSPTLQALQVGQSVVDTFSYTVSDGVGGNTVGTVTVRVTGANDVPTFTAITTTLNVDEGSLVTIPTLASVSDADANETLTYSINWGDGTALQTGNVTITSSGAAQPTLGSISGLSHGFPDNGTFNGLVTVTDSRGASITSPLTITVANVAPTASIDTAPTIGVPGMPLDFAFSATDPSPVDTAAGFTYLVDFGDGNGQVSLVDPAELKFIYTKYGTYTVEVIAIDKDGAESDPVSTEVVIAPVANIDGDLYVGGTSGADRIIISSSGGVSVRINNAPQKPQSVTGRVTVFGNEGNDTITVSGLNLPVELYGGEGDDYLTGGNGADLLDGGNGRDRLLGGNGNDTLLGGAGVDTLNGGNGNDYLSGDDMVDLLGGTDLPDGSVSFAGDVIPASPGGNDTINGDAGNDTIVGGEGNDSLYGGTGNDFIQGGDGNDKVDGGDGNDFLMGDAGADLIYGRAGKDVLIGGQGTDTLLGGASADLLFGGDLFDASYAETIWLLWTSNQASAAADELTVGGEDDGFADSLNGEADSDWYVFFLGTGDKVATANEQKSPNVSIKL